MIEGTAPADWPRFRSHKNVRAVKIISTGSGAGAGLIRAALESGQSVVLDTTLNPQFRDVESGGYLVAYADGYMSYSPAKAFEDGYSRLDDMETNAHGQGPDVGIPKTASAYPYPRFGE